ncbi:MAG: hypothetical protein M1814_005341 [Vezdaea aestivalis]|nr:MAG: hypothetical protein M1814_005341 [Vezdaea aestivalis]
MSKLLKRLRGRKSKGNDAGSSTTPNETSLLESVGKEPNTQPLNAKPSELYDHVGLFELSKSNDDAKTVDVIAVHGLQGHPYRTWTHENGHLWIQDSLTESVPFARIMTFGYDSTIAFSKSVAKIDDKALELLNRLGSKRRALMTSSSRQRPIVFICHSLGGIVVKKALILAHERSSDPFFKDIVENTKAIAFLGVPHKGSDSAWWANFAACALKASSIGLSTNTTLVADLKKDSSTLNDIQNQFIDRTQDLKIYTFYEKQKLFGVVVVDELSARMGITNEKPFPVEADHRTICHCPSSKSQEYEAVGGWVSYLINSVVEESAKNQSRGAIKTISEIPDDIEPLRQSVNIFQIPFYLDAPEIDYFAGRESLLLSMGQNLFSHSKLQRKVVVLHGLGGMGKTQSAFRYAIQHQQDYTAILWFNAKTEDTLKQSFQKNAERLPKGAISQTLRDKLQDTSSLQELIRTVKHWLAAPQNNNWLIIFDNHDNPKIPQNKDQSAYDIRPYFPEAYHGFIILTTRWANLKIGKSIQVNKLDDPEHALSILIGTSGRSDIRNEPGISDLIDTLDGLPLALATAGSYLSLESISVIKYLQHYQKSWLNLQQTSPELLSYEDRTLYSTWNISYNHIRHQDEAAANLLNLWSYFDNQDLWFELLSIGKDFAPTWLHCLVESEITFNAAMRKLRDHGLIHTLKDSGGYGMHYCVHAWTGNVLNDRISESKLSFVLECIGIMVPQTPRSGDSMLQRRLLPHANRCLQLLSQNDTTDILSIIDNVSNMDAFHSLGKLYRNQGKLAEAEAMYQRALKGKEKALGPDHTSTLDTVNNLGALYSDQGKLAEAEAMYQRALKGKEKAVGPDHTSTLDTVNNLGALYSDQGKLAEAEAMYQRALKGKEKALGPDHTSTLNTVNNLGNLYSDQGKLAEAEAMYQRALKGYEKALGPDHTSTLSIVNNLGLLYSNQGKLAEAEAMYQRALKGKEKALGPDHTSTLDIVNNLGLLYSNQDKLAEAEAMYQRALKGYEKALGPKHKSTSDTAYNLAGLYQQQENYEESIALFQQAEYGYRMTFGSQHPETVDALTRVEKIQKLQNPL